MCVCVFVCDVCVCVCFCVCVCVCMCVCLCVCDLDVQCLSKTHEHAGRDDAARHARHGQQVPRQKFGRIIEPLLHTSKRVCAAMDVTGSLSLFGPL